MKIARITINVMVFIFTICSTFIIAQADEALLQGHSKRLIRFDVAENGTRFVFDEAPVHEGTTPPMPAYGNPFITEGFIYPYGTIDCNDAGECSGTNPDGSPQFPENVIGRWTCRGWFVGDGMLTQTGPAVISTQIYDLGKVVLDLNGHTIEQSAEHALLQRFFAVIETAGQPFLSGQGPADFGDGFQAAENVIIKNGTIGRSGLKWYRGIGC